jgi:hypothetical protein
VQYTDNRNRGSVNLRIEAENQMRRDEANSCLMKPSVQTFAYSSLNCNSDEATCDTDTESKLSTAHGIAATLGKIWKSHGTTMTAEVRQLKSLV